MLQEVPAMYMGGLIETFQLIQHEFPQGLSLFGNPSDWFTWAIGLISSLGWGLGYFGQPHILVRFMAISDAKELKKSTNIAMVWVILSLMAAIAVGLIGHVYMLPDKLVGTDAETIFLIMTERLFTPFVAGLISVSYTHLVLPSSNNSTAACTCFGLTFNSLPIRANILSLI